MVKYLDRGVIGILLEEERDILRVILGFPNDVMYLRSDINLFIQHSSILLKLCTNTADARLPTFDLCQLLQEALTTRTSISSFG